MRFTIFYNNLLSANTVLYKRFNIRIILQRSENEMYFIKNDSYFDNDVFIRITMII